MGNAGIESGRMHRREALGLIGKIVFVAVNTVVAVDVVSELAKDQMSTDAAKREFPVNPHAPDAKAQQQRQDAARGHVPVRTVVEGIALSLEAIGGISYVAAGTHK